MKKTHDTCSDTGCHFSVASSTPRPGSSGHCSGTETGFRWGLSLCPWYLVSGSWECYWRLQNHKQCQQSCEARQRIKPEKVSNSGAMGSGLIPLVVLLGESMEEISILIKCSQLCFVYFKFYSTFTELFSALQLSGVRGQLLGEWSSLDYSDYNCSIANIVRGEWYSRSVKWHT